MRLVAWLGVTLVGSPSGAPLPDVPRPTADATEAADSSSQSDTGTKPHPQPPSPSTFRASFGQLPALEDEIVRRRHDRARDLGLRPLGDGGYVYAGTPGERFRAMIRPDGSVKFDAEPSVQFKLDRVCFLFFCGRTPRARREAKTRRAANDKAMVWDALSGSDGTPGSMQYGEPAGGSIEGSKLENNGLVILPNVQGRFGYLPPPNAAMQAFLDRTTQLRLELAEQAAMQRYDKALRRLPQMIASLWNDARKPSAQRRAELLELWSSLDAKPIAGLPELESRLDVLRREAARQARRKIEAFVRQQAPSGSPDAFTAQELEAFNRRPDVDVPFEPYAIDGTEPAVPPSP